MVAFHYPPSFGSSGVQRTLKFSRYLPECGWRPLVLTAHPRAYPQTNDGELSAIPEGVPVVRAFALDARRHLALHGSSLRVLGVPDQWISWWLGGVPAGLRLIRRHRPAVIWSTYPIATAHLVAITLNRITSIPWVADFRDPMVDGDYPSHLPTRRIHRWIEDVAAARAARVIFTTPSARREYLKNHPDVAESRCEVIQNGYDEPDFESIASAASRPLSRGYPVRIVHAGFVYQEERDPRPLFRAIARLRKDGRLDADNLRLDLRAPGSTEYFTDVIQGLDLQDIVFVLPPLPYREALHDSALADALLLLQGGSCDHQIPAKAYEYLRLNRPILALTGPSGDTAGLLADCGGATVLDLLDEDAIHSGLPVFLDSVRSGTHPLPRIDRTRTYSRHSQTLDLAANFAAVARAQ